VLQCDAQCVAVRCSVLLVSFDKPATKYRAHLHVAIRVAVRVALCCIVCCSALQSVLQCVAEYVAVRCRVLWVFFCKPSLRYVGCQNINMNEPSTVPCRVSDIRILKKKKISQPSTLYPVNLTTYTRNPPEIGTVLYRMSEYIHE